MTLTLRYMTIPDIAQVVAIDRQAFNPAWSPQSYAYEINESNYSHMLVIEDGPTEKSVNGLRRVFQNLGGGVAERRVVAYGGLWHIVDEAHISTIASHPELRGRGFGELALVAMLHRSVTLNAGYVMLEVRVSNVIAQRLYHKHNFRVTMTRPRYYHSDGEDAYEMRLNLKTDAARQQIRDHFAALLKRHDAVDRYSNTPAPRRPQ